MAYRTSNFSRHLWIFIGFMCVLLYPLTLFSETIDWQSQIIYFILIDRFQNGDSGNDYSADLKDPYSYHGGDIQGIIDKLDYLQKLGVTVLWLSPVFDNRDTVFFKHYAYHGYWVKDFFKVEEHFGNLDILRKLSDEVHRRGMYLILDMVTNHVDYDSPLTKEKPDWFHSTPTITDWGNDYQIENYRVSGMPDLAQEKPEVKEFLINMSRWWIDKVNPDGFRLDAVRHVPISFWRDYNDAMKTYKDNNFLLIGELLHGGAKYCADIVKNGHFNSIFDYPLYFTLLRVIGQKDNAEQLGVLFYQDYIYSNPEMLCTFLDNHDVTRFITHCNGEERLLRLGIEFLIAVRGIPTIYYGTEVGLAGEKEPDNRLSMTFGSNPLLTKCTERLLHLRRGSQALSRGIQIHLWQDSDTYIFGRISDDQVALVALNNQDNSRIITIPLTKFTPPIPQGTVIKDILAGTEGTVYEQGLKFQAKPRSLSIFLYQGEKTGIYREMKERFLALQKNPLSSGYIPVTFHLFHKDGTDNEKIYVIGNPKVLGEWNTSDSLGPMQNIGPGEYMIQTKLPAGGVFEYKYIKYSGTQPVWYPGKNLYLQLPFTGEIHTKDQW